LPISKFVGQPTPRLQEDAKPTQVIKATNMKIFFQVFMVKLIFSETKYDLQIIYYKIPKVKRNQGKKYPISNLKISITL
jgi:hypothetical protein